MRKKMLSVLIAGMFLASSCLGCGSGTAEPDDYVTNEGYEVETGEEDANTSSEAESSNKIALENVKIAVLYISDPNEGSELPADFSCPLCGHGPEDFDPIYE